MADETKPIAVEAPAPEATPAPEIKTEEPATAAEVAPEVETKPTEAVAETPAEEPVKEAEEAKEPETEVKPIYEGTLGYVPGPLGATPIGGLVASKFHFFFGVDPVAADKFKAVLKNPKGELAHAAAWSEETGEGLLYYVKDAAQKHSPHGVIALSEVEDLATKGKLVTFKIGSTTHALKATSAVERDGWHESLKQKIEQAKALKSTITGKDSYKENLDKFSKGGLLAVGAAAVAVPKKSFEDRKARSKSTDKERKDRSQSRSKKFFDSFRGKKDEAVEEPKAEAAEAAEAPATTEATETPAVEAAAADVPAVVEESPKEETPAAVKASRRGSKYFEKLRGAISPTREKKAEELIPSAAETTVAEAAPVIPAETIKTEESAAEVAEAAPAEETKVAEEVSPTDEAAKVDPKERRRSSFFNIGTLANLRKKSAAAVATDKAEEPTAEVAKEEEAPVAETAVETPVAAEEPTPEAVPEATPEAVTDAEKETAPKKENPLVALGRRASKAVRNARKPKPAAAEKVEEAKEDIPAVTSAEPEAPKSEEAEAVPEPAPITTTTPAVAATA